jgi:hypothetical protein
MGIYGRVSMIWTKLVNYYFLLLKVLSSSAMYN